MVEARSLHSGGTVYIIKARSAQQICMRIVREGFPPSLYAYTSFLVLIDLLASCIINIHQASRTSSIIHNTHTLFTYTRLLELLPSYSLHFQNFYHHTRLFHFFITAGVSPLIDTKFHIKLLLKSNSKTKISYFTIHKNSMFQNKQCSSYLCPIHPRNLGMLLTMTLFLDFDNVAAT